MRIVNIQGLVGADDHRINLRCQACCHMVHQAAVPHPDGGLVDTIHAARQAASQNHAENLSGRYQSIAPLFPIGTL